MANVLDKAQKSVDKALGIFQRAHDDLEKAEKALLSHKDGLAQRRVAMEAEVVRQKALLTQEDKAAQEKLVATQQVKEKLKNFLA